MSISRIVDLQFVYCRDCAYRRKVKDVRARRTRYKCELHATNLYSLSSGCSDGSRRPKR